MAGQPYDLKVFLDEGNNEPCFPARISNDVVEQLFGATTEEFSRLSPIQKQAKCDILRHTSGLMTLQVGTNGKVLVLKIAPPNKRHGHSLLRRVNGQLNRMIS